MVPANLVKARLREISWDEKQQVVDGKRTVDVQINPDSLKVTFSNSTAGGDQRGGSAIQFVGAGTMKLSFDLWFDVTNPAINNRPVSGLIPDDVRLLTEELAYFMKPKPSGQKDKFIPPGVRFQWGRFLFEGIMESLNEEISYFSEDGRALRAKLSVSLTRQEIQFQRGQQTANGVQSGAPSGHPRQQAKQNDTVSDLAGASGNADNWPAVAAANGIENPRLLAPGTILDTSAAAGLSAGAAFNAGAGISVSAGASGGIGFSAGAGATAGLSAGAGFGFDASASGALGGGLRAGVAASAGAGIGASAGAGGGAGIGAGAGIGIGAGASAGFGGGMSGGVGSSLGAGAGIGAGVSAGFGPALGGGASLGVGGLSVTMTPIVAGGSVGFGGAAASASARANASFDLRVRR